MCYVNLKVLTHKLMKSKDETFFKYLLIFLLLSQFTSHDYCKS